METINSKTIQEIHAIIDRSGSMMGKEADTIGGIKACFSELKKKDDNDNSEIYFSIKQFDHDQQLILRSTNIDDLNEDNISEVLSNYMPRGQTALLDALGESINYYVQKKLINKEAFESCVIYVSTDGYENCSKKFNYRTISEMIKTAEENHNIKILYLGANQDAIAEASKCGISSDRAINYSETSENTQAVYRSAAACAKRTRTDGTTGFLLPERTASCTPNLPSQSFSSPPAAHYSVGSQPFGSPPVPPPVLRVRRMNANNP